MESQVAPGTVWYGELSEGRRRVATEARAWGILTALVAAFTGPLLVARGADIAALGVYAAGISLFGLSASALGPLLARRAGSVSHPALASLLVGRVALLGAALALLFSSDGLVWPLIAALMVWSAGEGVASSLWTSFITSLAPPRGRAGWLAWRGMQAAGAAALTLPPLAFLALAAPQRAWQAALLLAAIAALVSGWQLSCLFASAPVPPLPALPPQVLRINGAERRFLLTISLFWFGAALNRPLLAPYQVHDLGATPVYFALAGAVAALVGLLAQRFWSRLAEGGRVTALLGLSGAGAGVVPLLWMVAPNAWVGLPIDGLAAGFWLGHLLGVALRCAQLAPADDERPSLVAATHLVQGIAATAAPLTAAALVVTLGTRPLLALSGAICLLATSGLVAGEREAGWFPAVRLGGLARAERG